MNLQVCFDVVSDNEPEHWLLEQVLVRVEVYQPQHEEHVDQLLHWPKPEKRYLIVDHRLWYPTNKLSGFYVCPYIRIDCKLWSHFDDGYNYCYWCSNNRTSMILFLFLLHCHRLPSMTTKMTSYKMMEDLDNNIILPTVYFQYNIYFLC